LTGNQLDSNYTHIVTSLVNYLLYQYIAFKCIVGNMGIVVRVCTALIYMSPGTEQIRKVLMRSSFNTYWGCWTIRVESGIMHTSDRKPQCYLTGRLINVTYPCHRLDIYGIYDLIPCKTWLLAQQDIFTCPRYLFFSNICKVGINILSHHRIPPNIAIQVIS
jgi:hypothetical protein